MANEITKSLLDSFIPTVAAATAMETLKANRGIARFVNTDFSNDIRNYGEAVKVGFLGSLGRADTKVEGSNYAYTGPGDSDVTITLNQHKHKTVLMTDIGRSFARPDVLQGYVNEAVSSVLEEVDISIASLAASLTNEVTPTANAYQDLVDLRKTLVKNKAPLSGPFIFTLNEDVYASLLKDTNISKALEYGTPVAVQDAVIPKVAGLAMFETQLIQSAGSPVKKQNMAFHRDAFAIAVRPLPVDGNGLGVKQGVYNDPTTGLSLRVTMGYDAAQGGMFARAEILYGVAIMRQGLAVAYRTV